MTWDNSITAKYNIMKKITKSIFAASLFIVALGITQITTSCTKEDVSVCSDEQTIITKKLPDKETLNKLAKKLNIKPEAIVKVEYRSGLYWCEDTYWSNGRLRTHKWGCDSPTDAACCAVVYVKVGMKGGAKKINESTVANGLLGYRIDDTGEIISIIFLFDRDNMNDYKWVDEKSIKFENDFPLINSNLIDAFDEYKTIFVGKGEYPVHQAIDNYYYAEIPAHSLREVEDIPVEE